jgi:IclR family mhp operon transcriptional activator
MELMVRGLGAKPVSALVRGLRVLAAANEVQKPTIAELVRLSGLPKATVIRLVQTLTHEGYVEELADAQGYRVTSKVRNLSRGLVGRTPVAQIVQPLLDGLGRRIKWPSEFFLPEGLSVVIEASNREAAPIKLHLFEHRRFPITASATGIAYLSALSEDRAESIVHQASAEATAPNAAASCLALVAEARRRGFSAWEYPALAPGLRMVSIPVRTGERVFGGLSVVHFRELVPNDLLDGFLLPEMRTVALRIAEALERETHPGAVAAAEPPA